ncbi:site-specific integrase [Echinicola rosea]|uniref:Integrase n=1 Tax=Echinicola rosea TaxID=1807691 RepID=A0ABQ1V1F7_9BACT|nr:site-specific integrase [Echinicola rosea]GGF34385.1 integrase [Echinicola rosea]
MAEFNYYLRDKGKDGETPITLFISYNSKRLKYPSLEKIHPKLWNDKKQLAKEVQAFPAHKIFNDTLSHIKGTAEKVFRQLKLKLERSPLPSELKDQLDIELNRAAIKEHETDKPITLIELFDRFITEAENGIRLTATGKRYDKRTIQKYRTTKNKLAEFGKSYHLTFDTINHSFYSKFVAYLNNEGYKLNSVGKYIMIIKTFLNYATEMGYNTNMYFKSSKFKAYSVTGFSIYLTVKELEELYKEDLSKTPHLERVRDLFLVGAWTGLRFSDFTTIKPENIQDGFLHIKTQKTGEKVIIPIHPTVKAIMAKYEGKYPNSLPPPISNQKMNDYLKDITKQVECLEEVVEAEYIKGGHKVTEMRPKWEFVTTHTARRSFATNVYKSGFPAISLMKITGHRTESAFLKYIKVKPEDVAVQLAEHWKESVLKVV